MSNINENFLFNLSNQLGLLAYDNNILSEFDYPVVQLTFPSYWSQSRRLRSVQDVLEETMHAKPVFKYVISEEGKKLLKEEIYDVSNENITSNICPISLVEFEQNEELIRLPCNHLFNKENIINWLEKEKSECPVCRYQLPSTEIRNPENEPSNNEENTSTDDNIEESNEVNTNNNIINDLSNNLIIFNAFDENDDDDDLDEFVDTYHQRQLLFNRLSVLDMILSHRYQ